MAVPLPQYLQSKGITNNHISLLGSVVALTLLVLLVRGVCRPLHYGKSSNGTRYKVPKGPPGVPLFGNFWQFKRARNGGGAAFGSWLLSLPRYGEMTTLRMGSRTWVVLNSRRVAHEIISKRGNITHERPYMPIASDLVSQGKRFLLQQTAQWTEARRVTHPLLSGSALKEYSAWQELESVQLLASYLYRPREWYEHHYRYTISIMHRIVLGERLFKSTPQLKELRRVINEFLLFINGHILDFFPKISRLPKFLQPWRPYYAAIGQVHRQAFLTWWEPVKAAIDNGTAPPSFVRDTLLHHDTRYTGTDEQAMYVAMSTISAGGDNPRMTMNCFTMAALSFPSVMHRARIEVDTVCGDGTGEYPKVRLPTVDDMPAMPYMCALIKEVARWRPTVPMIPQHQLVQDLEFEGYHFPAGTEFFINGFAVGMDYPNPKEFRPERWIDGAGHEHSLTHDLWHFGGGRRICVGYRLGQTELFLAFSRLLYCFDYSPAGPFDNTQLRHFSVGEPFPVKVTVRSALHKRLIDNEAEQVGVLGSARRGFNDI